MKSAEDALFGPAVVPFGNIGGNGRYRMPLLPGEPGVATGGDWVPHGVMRATRLASAIEDTKSLNEWEQRHMMRGLVLDVSLYEELGILVRDGMRAGVDWDDLPEKHPDIRDAMTGKPNDSKSADASIAGRAKHMAGGNVARQKGTNRHAVWDARAEHGQWIGSDDINAQLTAVEGLLDKAGFERVPGLHERVIRNMAVDCAGRFDDVLISRRTGKLFIADLKTKRKPFKSWLTVDAQLAIYARAEHMLEQDSYVPGPLSNVDQERGIVLVCPSDGSDPYLRPADLVTGWRTALLAREVVDLRAYARSVARGNMTVGEW